MRKKIIFAILALSLSLSLANPLPASDENVGALFKKVDKYLALRDKLPNASDSFWSWVPFTADDKSQIQDDINAYLDQSLAVLLDDEAIKTKNEINRLESENRQTQEKIAQLELEKTTAPTDTSKLKFWTTSASQIDDKIESLKKKIQANISKIEGKRNDIKRNLEKSNIFLTNDQIKTLLITVSGQDQLDAIVALKNLYNLTETLKNLMRQSNNLTINKKYYGVFLLATEAHERQLNLFLDRLNNQYLPSLQALKEENLALMAETRRLAAEKPIYQSNVAAQAMTDEVADKYRDLLTSQRRNLEERRAALAEVLQYVANTYKTVSLASSLATSMEESLNTLQAILEMPILPPVAFENSLEATFLELSEKIAAK
ncbi:MAG: hypothetical protein LBR11_09875 [Deltaproteobacteria bacterium]|jgi:hypothetical protein|nr:hypothetical protein [Deltaproteobacteria bacterium]